MDQCPKHTVEQIVSTLPGIVWKDMKVLIAVACLSGQSRLSLIVELTRSGYGAATHHLASPDMMNGSSVALGFAQRL